MKSATYMAGIEEKVRFGGGSITLNGCDVVKTFPIVNVCKKTMFMTLNRRNRGLVRWGGGKRLE